MKIVSVLMLCAFPLITFGDWAIKPEHYTYEIGGGKGIRAATQSLEVCGLGATVYGPQPSLDFFDTGRSSPVYRPFVFQDFKATIYYPRNVVFHYFLSQVHELLEELTNRVIEQFDDLQVVRKHKLGQGVPGFAPESSDVWEIHLYKWDDRKKKEADGEYLPASFQLYNELVDPSLKAVIWVELTNERIWFVTGYNRFLDQICPLVECHDDVAAEVKKLRHLLLGGGVGDKERAIARLAELGNSQRLDVARLLVDTFVCNKQSKKKDMLKHLEEGLAHYTEIDLMPLFVMSFAVSESVEKRGYYAEKAASELLDLFQDQVTDPDSVMDRCDNMGRALSQKLSLTWEEMNESINRASSGNAADGISMISKLKKDVNQHVFAPRQEEQVPLIRIFKKYYGDDICPYLIHTALTTEDDILRERCVLAFRAIASPNMLMECLQALSHMKMGEGSAREGAVKRGQSPSLSQRFF